MKKINPDIKHQWYQKLMMENMKQANYTNKMKLNFENNFKSKLKNYRQSSITGQYSQIFKPAVPMFKDLQAESGESQKLTDEMKEYIDQERYSQMNEAKIRDKMAFTQQKAQLDNANLINEFKARFENENIDNNIKKKLGIHKHIHQDKNVKKLIKKVKDEVLDIDDINDYYKDLKLDDMDNKTKQKFKTNVIASIEDDYEKKKRLKARREADAVAEQRAREAQKLKDMENEEIKRLQTMYENFYSNQRSKGDSKKRIKYDFLVGNKIMSSVDKNKYKKMNEAYLNTILQNKGLTF